MNNINCEAKNCLYHKGKSTCTANEIRVGCSDACCCDETKCSSFKIREAKAKNNVIPT
ncbi:MAG: DUF1540 domain-containing protein [Clostridiales bacterium]|nr:DUF1540 domain-containing protein [Clostridia bacterium]MCR4564317.1 DUF1540 domain-containing protein [Clostridiales bacterium]